MPAISSTVVLLNFAAIILLAVVLIVANVRSRAAYLVAVFLIAFDILLITQLTSPHVIGKDVQLEKYIADRVIALGQWLPASPRTNINDLLSTSILPTMVVKTMSITTEAFLKYVMSLVYAFVPLLLFLVFEEVFKNLAKFVGGFPANPQRFAFIATLVFVFNFAFFMGPSNSRIIPAFLGIALAVFAIAKPMGHLQRFLIIILASILVIASHYVVSAYYILALLLATLLSMWFSKTARSHAPLLGVNFLILVLVLDLNWYFIVTTKVAEAYVMWPMDLLQRLGTMFAPTAYSPEMWETVIEVPIAQGLPVLIMKVAGNAIRVLIGIGFLFALYTWIWKGRKIITSRELVFFLGFSICSFIPVVLSFLPDVTLHYDIQRTYLQALLTVSVFFPIGLYSLARLMQLLSKRADRAHLVSAGLGAALLVAQFLSQTGTVSYLSGTPETVYYSDPVIQNHITLDQEVVSGQWLVQYREPKQTINYVRMRGGNQIIGYAHLFWSTEYKTPPSNTQDLDPQHLKGSIYVQGPHDEIESGLYLNNKVYTTGIVEIYYSP